MTRSRQASRRAAVVSKKRGGSVLHEDMKKLLELQKQQEIRFRPEVVDVPRIRFKPQQLYNVELSYASTVVTNSSTATLGALTFQLNSAPNSASYAAIFDQYRIIQVNVKFFPFATAAGTPVPGSGGFLYTVIDYDDANAPGTQDALLAYGTLKITPGGVIEERTLTPKFSLAAYNGVAFSGYSVAPSKMFLDCANPAIPYYGLKYGFSTSPQAQNIRIVTTLMLQFKNNRST